MIGPYRMIAVLFEGIKGRMPSVFGILSFLIFLAIFGCATITEESALVKKLGGVEMKTAEVQLRVRSLAMPIVSRVETASDRIIATSPDPGVRRGALLWKIEAVPVLYQTILHPDPLVAVLDTWAFVYQMRDYFDKGPGRSALGKSYKIAVDSCDDINRMILAFAREVKPGVTGEKVREWAQSHPITGTISGRTSVEKLFARAMAEKDMGALAAAGAAVEGLNDLTERVDLYAAFLPKAARWQAELLLSDLGAKENLQVLTADVARIASVERVAELADGIPALVSQEREILLREVQAYSDRLSQDLEDRSLKIIDHVFLRAMQVVGVIALVLFVCVFILARAMRRRTDEANQ
jgi:hypothetical protein